MSIVTLVSAGGSPGVTTTALGMALLWPRNCLLVDADPCPNQAVLSGYLEGRIDAAGRGLPWIAEAYRRTLTLDDVIFDQSMPLPPLPWRATTLRRAGSARTEVTGTGADDPGSQYSVRFLPGYTHPGAAGMFSHVWGAFAAALTQLDATCASDVIVDLGRLGSDGIPRPLLQASQQVVLVTRSSLRALARLRLHVEGVRDAVNQIGKLRSLFLVAIGPDDPYSVSEIAAQFSLPVLGTVPWAPAEAEALSDGASSTGRVNQMRLSNAYSRLGSLLREQNVAWSSRMRTRATRGTPEWLEPDEPDETVSQFADPRQGAAQHE